MDKILVYRQFQDLPEYVSDLFKIAGQEQDFSLTQEWYRHLSDTTREHHQELRIYCLERNNMPALLLPMYGCINGRWPWHSRQLSSLSNYYSALTGAINIGTDTISTDTNSITAVITSSDNKAAIASMVNAMTKERPRWDTIKLHPLSKESSFFSELIHAFSAAGMPAQSYFCFGNWYLDVAGRNFQTYFATLPSKLRNTIERKTQQLNATGRLRIDILSDNDQLEAGIENYQRVYRASWKKPEPYIDFIPGLIRLCARQHCLRLGIAYIDDIPAAAQIWIVHNGVASIYKLAYDTQFSAFSVGSILTGKLMQQVIDIDRVREVDYLMGDDAYKQDWMSHRRERWGIIAFNLHTPRGLLAALRHGTARVIKQLLSGTKKHFQYGKKSSVYAVYRHIFHFKKSEN